MLDRIKTTGMRIDSMTKKTICTILVLAFAAGIAACFSLNNKKDVPTKEEFFAKHHIKGDTLIPADFNFDECEKILAEKVTPNYAKLIIEDINHQMTPPELFDGFYPVQNRVTFYDASYFDNFLRLGFTEQEIEDLNLIVTEEKERSWSDYGVSKKEFQKLKAAGEMEDIETDRRIIRLIGRIGENIYIDGLYGDFGTSGSRAEIFVKKGKEPKYYRSDITLNACWPVAEYQDLEYPKAYECDLTGGYNTELRYAAMNYEPLEQLLNIYYKVYADYVTTYIQKQKAKFPKKYW